MDVASLCCKQHTVVRQDPQTRARVSDRLHGVLHLVQAPCKTRGVRKQGSPGLFVQGHSQATHTSPTAILPCCV